MHRVVAQATTLYQPATRFENGASCCASVPKQTMVQVRARLSESLLLASLQVRLRIATIFIVSYFR
jgi:hypothetical protein